MSEHEQKLNAEDLSERWGIKITDLFEYLSSRLSAYTDEGWRIVDEATLPHGRRFSLEELMERDPIQREIVEWCSCQEEPCIEIRIWEQRKREEYENQPLEPIPPPHCYPMSFRAPTNYHELEDAKSRLALCRFRLDDVLRFEQQRPELRLIIPEKAKERENTESFAPAHSEAQDQGVSLNFFKSGDYWFIGPTGTKKPLAHLRGFEFMHFLIKYADTEHLALEVYHCGAVPEGARIVSMTSHHKLDPKAQKEVKENLEKLKNRLSKVEDSEEHSRIKKEMHRFQGYLHDSKHSFESEQKNQRTSVQKAIRKALAKVHNELPIMKHHLNEQTIKTGGHCCYRSNPSRPVRWILEDPTPAI